ncbi:hypothetical protein COCC4DRAFT_48633 [Bipolaris maydis ATCC 48331]|uniref:Uncharacterized protein n=2 Tax=Cochliobolus heterostrophus TaxID=5016 RepID=M2UZG3_COCH5|nr:uncharacterized protein COCC4DRAFT_48633 [Bipolaris maydis ATCC 48331]EMD93188.1 hypothetical protein COCHEDRAFT_1222985 [Bipolaris maydis C5]EMD94181.1 hypothetical protein COCHEDRAFT_1222753 [Bipolaris maydis C5]ENI07519.1 hypothetical protein COCC4DRAFT_48633 [Bipolaris maydis ATCC 48331]
MSEPQYRQGYEDLALIDRQLQAGKGDDGQNTSVEGAVSVNCAVRPEEEEEEEVALQEGV